jgi:hypothetical protein
MDPAAPKRRRVPALAKTVAKFAAGWTFVYWFGDNDSRLSRLGELFRGAIYRVFADSPTRALHAQAVFDDLTGFCGQAFLFTLAFGTFFGVVGALTRMLARSRVRAGQADFLDHLRAWTAAHPNVTRSLLAAPTILWMLNALWPGSFELSPGRDLLGPYSRAIIPLLLAGWGMFAMTKKGLRELLAPTMGGANAATDFAISPDEIAFDAVAVTRRTVAIVTVFSALMLAIPLAIAKLPILDLFHHGDQDLYLFGAYIAFAATGAYAFRKASRVAVGVDGVHVRGTSRARFFPYRDLEAARTNGSDLELVRRGKVVLRLQLHGEDAARRDAVLARIREHIDRVREGRGAVAAQLVATSSRDDLARVAHGGGDYRMATMTREQLWALVEGSEVDADARTAAAEALVRSGAGDERARLRVAADHCAEPAVRIALEELAAAEHELPTGAAPRGLPPARPPP